MLRTLSMFSALSALLLVGAANVGAYQNPATKQASARKAGSTSRATASPKKATRPYAASSAEADGKGQGVHAAPGMPVTVDNGKTAPYDGAAANAKPAAKGGSTLKAGGKQ